MAQKKVIYIYTLAQPHNHSVKSDIYIQTLNQAMRNVKQPNTVLDDKPQQALEKRSRNDDLTENSGKR